MIHISTMHHMINFLPNIFRKAIRLVNQYEYKNINTVSAVLKLHWCMEQWVSNTYFREL